MRVPDDKIFAVGFAGFYHRLMSSVVAYLFHDEALLRLDGLRGIV